MKNLLLLSSLIISLNGVSLYLHDDEERPSENTLSSWCEENLDNCLNFLSEKGLSLVEKIKNKVCHNTLIGSHEIEEECDIRKNSDSYKKLQLMSFIVVPIVGVISSFSSLDDLVFLQLPVFCAYYGIDIMDALTDFFVRDTAVNESYVKKVVNSLKSTRSLVLVSLFPASFLNALFIDKLGNEVAARCTHSLNCSNTMKDTIFFLVKNGTRTLVYLDSLGAFQTPIAGKSDFPEDFSIDMREVYSLSEKGDYGIHLMWVNDAIKEQTFVFADADLHETPVVDHIFGWSKIGRAARLSFWYDSRFTTDAQVKATKDLFSFHNLLCGNDCTEVQLRDVTELDFFRAQKDAFSILAQTAGTFWATADIFRLAVLVEEVAQCAHHACVEVYQDLDNIPLNPEWMLNLETLKKIYKFGVVLHSRVDYPFPNSTIVHTVDRENSMIMLTKSSLEHEFYKAMLDEIMTEAVERHPRSNRIKAESHDQVYYHFLQCLYKHFGLESNRASLPSKCTPTIDTPINQHTIPYFN